MARVMALQMVEQDRGCWRESGARDWGWGVKLKCLGSGR